MPRKDKEDIGSIAALAAFISYLLFVSFSVCKTGEAKITEGFGLLSRYVIHTVGPRYNVKYVTAAEGALYSSYRNVIQIAR